MSSLRTAAKTTIKTGEELVFDAQAPRLLDTGICATCNHQASCLFLKAARRPIVFCDEFDDAAGAAAVTFKPLPIAREEFNYGEAQELGLCANCATKTGCSYRKPGAAVWNCEDYS